MSLRILQISNRVSWPLTDGGAIGIHYYIQGYLEAGAELSLLCMNTTRHPADVAKLPAIYQRLKFIKAVPVDNSLRPWPALRSLLRGGSYNLERFESPEFSNALKGLLSNETFDVIHLDGLYVAPYIAQIRAATSALLVMRHHNVEYQIWERLTAQATNPLKKWYLGVLTRRLKNQEQRYLNAVDLALPISTRDETSLIQLGLHQTPAYVHPFGVKRVSGAYPSPDPTAIYHIGAMDWLPNQESVDWLLEKVWPLVREQAPQAVLHLAGRNMPQRYLELGQEGVKVHGEVPDARLFEEDKAVLAVPLLSGGGVRIKIFEALAAGKCVVTTSIGVEGIEAQDAVHLRIADTPEGFAQALVWAVNHPAAGIELGKHGQALIVQRYDQQKLMAGLLKEYERLIETRKKTTKPS